MPRIAPWLGYVVALMATAVAVLARLSFEYLNGPSQTFLLPFLLPVFLAAWLAGWWCGLFATMLNAGIAIFFFTTPVFSFRISELGELVRVLTFVFVSVLVSSLNELLHRYRRRAEQDARTAKQNEERYRLLAGTLEQQVRERTAALRESERRFEAIFHAQFQFIGLMSPEGVLLEANRTALAAAGVRESEVLGRPLWDTIWWTHDPLQQDRLRAAVPRAALGEQIRFEASHVTPDGSIIWVDFSLTPFRHGTEVVLLIPEGRDITARKRIERAMAQSEEQFRSSFEFAPIGMALVAPDGRWLRVNHAICELVGYTEEELLKTDFQTITHPEDLDADLGLVGEVLAGHRLTYQMEKRYFHKQGQTVYVLLSVSLVRSSLGEPLHFISQIVDISPQKIVAQQLAAQERLLRQFIAHTPAAIAMFDRGLRYLQVSERWLTDYKLSQADLTGRSHYEVFPDIPDRWRAIHQRVLAGAVESCTEDPYLRQDGSTEWLYWECRPWHRADGEVGGIIMFTQVITERILATEAQLASEERFRVLFEQSSDAHLIFGSEGIIDCNHAAIEMLRCQDKQALLALHPAALSPEYQPDGRRSLEKCIEMDAIAYRVGYHRFDWLHQRMDGEVFLCEVTLTPVELRGQPTLLVVWHDLTERVRSVAALQESEERYRTVVESLAEGVVVQNAAGLIIASNRRASEILGLSPDQIAGRDSLDPKWRAIREDETPFPGEEHPAMVALRTGQPVFESVMGIHRPDGSRTWMIVNAVPFDKKAGMASGVVASFHDITEARRLVEQVRQSLREKEILLKEIHHRVKNNLQIVSTLLDLQSGYTTDAAALSLFQESRGRVKSMALIHERLYRSADLAGVDFAAYVRQLTDELYRTYKVSDDEIQLLLEVTMPPLPIDLAIPCGLLLNELMSNCFKHAFRDCATGQIRVVLSQEGDINILAVTDNGAGFPPGFDHHNTTSFGLQLVHTLTEQLGGELEWLSHCGTTARVRFPKMNSDSN